jgi:hypothetical protein
MYFFCVVLRIVCFVTFSVLFVCICVLNSCHRVATQLHLNISYHISRQQYFVSRNAEWLGLEINLQNKVTTKTYGTAYEMPCISRTRGRRKQTLGGVSVKWCPSLRCGFACGSGPWVWPCLCVTHTEHRPWDATRNVPRSPPLALHVRVRTLPLCTFDPSVSPFHAHTVPLYQAFRSCSILRIISSHFECLPCFIWASLFGFSLL